MGSLIYLSLVKDFTNEFYVVESICGEEEVKVVEKSTEYKDNYKLIRQQNDLTFRDGDADTIFDFDDLAVATDKIADIHHKKDGAEDQSSTKRNSVSYEDIGIDSIDSEDSEDSEDSDQDLDDL